MERLTDTEQAKCIGLSVCGGGCKTCPANNPIYKKLAELEDKIEGGRLIELPCKVGTAIYYVKEHENGKFCVYDGKVAEFSFDNEPGCLWICIQYNNGMGFYRRVDACFGKTIFLTRAEAERAKGGVE